MKLLLYMALLLFVCFLPVQSTDVGKLIPVEVLAVSEQDGVVNVRTDTGNQGKGNSIPEAFADLKDTASGTIYLDTAEYLLLEPAMAENTAAFAAYLKSNTRICVAEEGIELEGIAKYLSAHRPGVSLDRASEVPAFPVITGEDGRYWIR